MELERLEAAFAAYKTSGDESLFRRLMLDAHQGAENHRVLWEKFMRRNAELEEAIAALRQEAGPFIPITQEPAEPGLYIVADEDCGYAELWWWAEEDWTERNYGMEIETIPAHWDSSEEGDGDWKDLKGDDSWAFYYRRVALPRREDGAFWWEKSDDRDG